MTLEPTPYMKHSSTKFWFRWCKQRGKPASLLPAEQEFGQLVSHIENELQLPMRK